MRGDIVHICRNCGNAFTIKHANDWLCSDSCKEARRKLQAKATYRRHYEKTREKRKTYYEANKDRILAKSREHYHSRYKDKHKVHARKFQLKQYGMTPVDYEALHKIQQGRCLICWKKAKLVVDHNHETGRVRGLLCKSCNTGIGLLKDSPEILAAAITYLDRRPREQGNNARS